ncbi:MAG: hypothetical protein BHV99_03015 [Clostridium sp. 26_21]|nr:MAG: hypothetical protein BHV99_03015 [Clostridium sp. 26_21]
MKKVIIFLVTIVIIVCIIAFQYNSYKRNQNSISSENAEFEKYTNNEIYGIDLATIVNKSIDKNEKNKILKDEKGFFIQNDENSIEVEIHIKENDTTYKMEQIYKQGTEQFVQFFINEKFKCSKVEYHEKTDRIKYMLFEQI